MKTIILALNSQYVHTLLAPRYLLANCHGKDVSIVEGNVNMQMFDIVQEVYSQHPDVVSISCYIFNIKFVRTFLQEIKLVLPHVLIIVGGYEVAFDTERYSKLCDYIIKGEGDFVFNDLLDDIFNKTHVFPQVVESGTVCNLDEIASPYSEEYSLLGQDKILYFESSRGCPFSCSYCMSANTHGVRCFSLERTFDDLFKIMKHEPKQVKFVDRTFNFDIKRAKKIFRFILDNFASTKTNFHFETAPELFDEELFELLKEAPKGKFQFEIGVQSYNTTTLSRVGRIADIAKIEKNIATLVSNGNINIHVDLIAGLPEEDINSFIVGFNRLFAIRPNCLQLGFLKVLKGSQIFNEKDEYVVSNVPPYEIVSSPKLSFEDILLLKKAENMLEIFYNSGRFKKSILFLAENYVEPFELFVNLANFFQMRGKTKIMSAISQCDMLFDFAKDYIEKKKDFATTTRKIAANNVDTQGVAKATEVVLDYEKDCEQYFEKELESLINSDFSAAGNVRKWRRN